jgi:hypothetical protein
MGPNKLQSLSNRGMIDAFIGHNKYITTKHNMTHPIVPVVVYLLCTMSILSIFLSNNGPAAKDPITMVAIGQRFIPTIEKE